MNQESLLRVLLYEGHDSNPLDPELRYEFLGAALDKGYSATRVTTLGEVNDMDEGTLVVLGDFAEKQPNASDYSNETVKVHFHDVGQKTTTEILSDVEQYAGQQDAQERKPWKPWFPVIDYDRCTNCMQCLSFCLFDVYGVDEDKQIQVQNQSNCKTDCPACSRVCPEVAILFPKYRGGPINGDVVSSDDVRQEKMKVDISSLLGGDIYAALRDRSAKAKSRFSKERSEDRALKERQKCLVKLQQNLDIPPEVIASLPSMDQIQAKAEAAQAKANAALDSNS